MSDRFELLTYATMRPLPGADADEISARKTELLDELRRDALTQDPRPDLTEDSAWWTRLLTVAYARDGTDPQGLFGALHGLRCCGARLARCSAGLRLVSGEMDAVEYAQDRARWLVPHKAALNEMIKGVAAM